VKPHWIVYKLNTEGDDAFVSASWHDSEVEANTEAERQAQQKDGIYYVAQVTRRYQTSRGVTMEDYERGGEQSDT
jgi:hypothetical protein